MDQNQKQVIAAVVRTVVDLLLKSDEEDIQEVLLLSQKSKRRRVCQQNYFEDIVTRYSISDFKSHFRLEKTTMELLLGIIAPYYATDALKGGRPKTPIEKQLLISIWFLANQEVYRSIADRFDVSKASVWEFVHTLCDILVRISGMFIKWPDANGVLRTTQAFERKNGFPGIIGAIDVMPVPIIAPHSDQAANINRNRYHSISLQAVVDENYKFIDCFTGCVGSMHDARVFRLSDLGRRLTSNPLTLCPPNTHILADSAYKLTTFMLVPYKDNGHLTRRQKFFNTKLSQNRVKVEQSFGQLRGRMRCLKMLNIYRTNLIPKVILACCVIHNICISVDDLVEADRDNADMAEGNPFVDDEIDDAGAFNNRERISDFLYENV